MEASNGRSHRFYVGYDSGLSYANALGDTPARFRSRGVGDVGESATWPGGRAYGTWTSRIAWLNVSALLVDRTARKFQRAA